MASGSLFFTKSTILPIFDPILQQEGRRKYELQLYHPYQKNLTSVSSYLGSRYFQYKKKSKMASGSLFSTKSAILPIFDPILMLQQEVKKESGLQLYHPYHKNPTSVASYLGSRYFSTKKVEKWHQDHYFSQKVLLVGTPSDTYTYFHLTS